MPTANFTIDEKGECGGLLITLISQAIDGDSIHWVINGQEIWNGPEHQTIVIPLDSTSTLMQIAYNGKCSDTSAIAFMPMSPPPVQLTMPNVFTPFTSIGINDLYCPIGFDGEYCYELRIFNRWGRKVFSSSEEMPCWDGFSTDSGLAATPGVYYYVLTYGTVKLEGFLHLLEPQ
jgi:gliding motility-associated-like protein